MSQVKTHEVVIFDQNVEDIFLKYVDYNKSTVNKTINVAILLYLNMQVGLTKEDREKIRAAVKSTKQWVYG